MFRHRWLIGLAAIAAAFLLVTADAHANGEAGIANERLRSALVGAAVGFCRQHQNSTIFIEATNAYRELGF